LPNVFNAVEEEDEVDESASLFADVDSRSFALPCPPWRVRGYMAGVAFDFYSSL